MKPPRLYAHIGIRLFLCANFKTVRKLRTLYNQGRLLTVLCASLMTHIAFSQEIKNCPDPLPYLIGKDVIVYNMGGAINSEFAEYNAVFNSDGSFMIFTTRNDSSTGEDIYGYDGLYYEDIMISEKKGRTFTQGTNAADRPDLFPIQINTEKHEAPVFLGQNDSAFIIYKHDKLWHAELTDTGYTSAEIYGENINISTYQRHASVTADGNTMYFSSEVLDKKTGRLHHDIFVSQRAPNGSWLPATALGQTINTLYDEDSPEISPDGRAMFFASQKPGGLGGYDIYYTALKDSTWTAPINLCAPINSPAHDIYFKLSKFGPYAYFSSNRLGGFGNMDLYKVLMNRPWFEACKEVTDGFEVEVDAKAELLNKESGHKYYIDMGDGSAIEGTRAYHRYLSAGTYVITLVDEDLKTGIRQTLAHLDTIVVGDQYGTVRLSAYDTVEVGRTVRFDARRSRLNGRLVAHYFWRANGKVWESGAEMQTSFNQLGTQFVDLFVNAVNEDSIDLDYTCITKRIEVVTSEDFAAFIERNRLQTRAEDLIGKDEILVGDAAKAGNPLQLINDQVNTLVNTPLSIHVFDNDGTATTRNELQVNATTRPSNGVVRIRDRNAGVTWYMPNRDYVGVDRFEYVASANQAEQSKALVLIQVKTEDQMLLGYALRNDIIQMAKNESVEFNVFKNDQFQHPDDHVLQAVSKAKNGMVGIVNDSSGIVKYTPKIGFSGVDAFTYRVRDKSGVQHTAFVQVKVGIDSLEDMSQKIRQINAGQPVLFDLFLGDDLEKAKGRKLTSIIGPDGGSVKIMDAEEGLVLYLPKNNFRGLDGFTYYFEDEHGKQNAGGVSIVVGGEADPSQLDAKPDHFVTSGANAITFTVLENDFALNDGQMELVDISRPTNGSVEIVNAAKGEARYVPNEGFTGEEVLTYTIMDMNGLRSRSNVTINVHDKSVSSKGLLLAMDEYETSMNEPLLLFPLQNDQHFDNRNMEIISVDQPQHGYAELSNRYGGEVLYIPADGFVGQDRFVYEVIDSRGLRAKAEVVITVISPLAAATVDTTNVPDLELENIYFAFDDDRILASAIPALQRNLAKLKANPNVVLKVSSHCDARGSKAYNVDLSSRRAINTLNYLVEHGLSKNRLISVVGMGEEALVNDCDDGVNCPENKHQQNRRSEFKVVAVFK